MKVYFLGIAGAGMSALASILKSEGHEVQGSDEDVFPPISTYLDAMAIPWRDGFEAALMPPDIDIAIVGASAKLRLASNPELAELDRRGVPRASFPEFLAHHTARRENLVIAGSFGKSTMAALVTVLLREAGRDPGFFIGAVPLDLEATGGWGHDPAFVLEGDEYIVGGEDRRPKFLLYHPHALLITSLVHDHINVYPTMESYEQAFAELLDLLPRQNLLVCAAGFPALHRIASGRAVVWYGRERCAGYWADELLIGEVTSFDLVTPKNDRITLETELLGHHNVENIVGAAALLLERGDIDAEALAAGVRRFRGVERRLDKKTRRSRVPAFEGFGSSYEKARSAIEAVRLHFPRRSLVVIFEPHAFSWRNADALCWYDTVFEGAAKVLILPPPAHGADNHRQLGASEILARVRAAGVAAESLEPGRVVSWLADHLRGEEVILLLSSGPLGGLARTVPEFLENRFG